MRVRGATSRILKTVRVAVCGLAAVAPFGTTLVHGQEPPTTNPCFGTPVFAVITGVTKHGDLALGPQDIRVRLADISLPDAEPWRQRAIAALNRLIGSEVAAGFETKPDRWGLQRAVLATEAGDLATGLVADGLAVANPGEARNLCNPHLLAVEQKARNARAGLWADSANRPLAADDPAALLQRAGRFSLAHGRVVNVGVRQNWVYLNFGRSWKRDFTATISSATWERMREKGVTAEMLTGKRVMVRGIIRQWNGPSLEVSSPEMLEIISNRPGRT